MQASPSNLLGCSLQLGLQHTASMAAVAVSSSSRHAEGIRDSAGGRGDRSCSSTPSGRSFSPACGLARVSGPAVAVAIFVAAVFAVVASAATIIWSGASAVLFFCEVHLCRW